jgi:hypothetical protein
VIRNEKGQIISGTPNPNGRPKGAVNFSTKWRIFVEKVAKQNGMTPDEIDEQLLAIGFKKAKEGDYNFYRDIHDRVYGRPVQHTDLTTGGEKITNDTLVDELTKKLNAIHKGASISGNGGVTSPLDTEVQN